MQHLSDVFKFTQGLGQKGHQIGRKVGDAIELLTLGMIDLEPYLSEFLVIEDGVEGATSAKHKVEFSFYNKNNKQPTKRSEDLFGIIECKKVGVEQTVKQSFKTWMSKPENKTTFFNTNGYTFINSPTGTNFKWSITVKSTKVKNYNLSLIVTKKQNKQKDIIKSYNFYCGINSQILIVTDVNNELYVLGPNNILSKIKNSINKCIIIQIKELENNKVKKININEALPGPQTPEKAKQASFVSLDVRKKVLGRFDKTENKSFVSILVIGEISHWEEKSRSIINLCNDYNLFIPDKILVFLFQNFEKTFGENYQNLITKTKYKENENIRKQIRYIIEYFDKKILKDIKTNEFVKFKHANVDGNNRLIIEKL